LRKKRPGAFADYLHNRGSDLVGLRQKITLLARRFCPPFAGDLAVIKGRDPDYKTETKPCRGLQLTID
jgi:hypothetical protein